MPSLTGKQRRHLRALAHHLEPVVYIGQNGLTAGVVAAAKQALQDHELIKVKLPEDKEGRKELAAELAKKTASELAQVIGRIALLFKKRKEKSKIEVPRDRSEVPAKASKEDRPE